MTATPNIPRESDMQAAIYARKSSEQTGVADEARSVTRQIEHAKAYALRKGWAVLPELIFIDDGVSGAEFERRPGFQRLLASLKPRPIFQNLIVLDESRLGREQIEVASVLKRFSLAGVTVHCYLDDNAVQLDTPISKVMLALRGFRDEEERSRSASRTYDAMKRKALLGHVTGGKVFGYDNVEIESSVLDPYGRPKRDHVERRINAEQAEVVRKIFKLCADGKGMVSIARQLNDDGFPAPRNTHGIKQSWSPSSVRSVLFRRLYLGEVVWNQTKKRNAWGQQQQKKRPASEWLTIPMPQLQVVTEDEWKAAHDRLDATRLTYLRGTKGELWGRPASNLDSKYLLTGLVKCGTCGGSVYVKTSSRKGTRAFFYGCMTNHLRGRAACSNGLLVPMERANEEVLSVLDRQVLHPDVTKTVVRKALEKFKVAEREWREQRQGVYKKIAAVDAESKRLVEAISIGGNIPALIEAMKDANERRETLSQELAAIENHQQQRSDADYDQLEKELNAHFESCWRQILTRQVGPARQILRKVFHGERIPLTPVVTETGDHYEFSGTAAIGQLVTGRAKAVVSPTGFEPVLLP